MALLILQAEHLIWGKSKYNVNDCEYFGITDNTKFKRNLFLGIVQNSILVLTKIINKVLVLFMTLHVLRTYYKLFFTEPEVTAKNNAHFIYKCLFSLLITFPS